MNSDKNTLWGFVLLGILLVGYILYNQKQQAAYETYKKAQADSIALVQKNIADSLGVSVESLQDSSKVGAPESAKNTRADSSEVIAGNKEQYGSFWTGNPVEDVTVNNNLFKITFSSRGAFPKKVFLNKYKAYNKAPLELLGRENNEFNLQFLTTDQRLINTGDLNFDLLRNELLPDSTHELIYRLYAGDSSKYLQYAYKIYPDKYLLDFNISAVGLQGIISPTNGNLKVEWDAQANQQEKDPRLERNNTQIYAGKDNSQLDYWTLERHGKKDITESIQWLSFKQQFFNQTLIASGKNFTEASFDSKVGKDEDSLIAQADMNLQIPYSPSENFSFPMQILYGPNDYYQLKSYGLGLENVVPLGYGIYTFAKYINKWLFLPLFVFLGKLFGGAWGIVIIFMTIVIRLLISPLTYKSYLSQAKMKALKPELDELKKKYEGDQQKFGMAQMNLYRQVGVSPLGGCLPMLLQLPIFAGLYCLFQSAIQVRQQPFLWVKDLSRYDSILNLPFNIPMYGDHVSLLTILMAATSMAMALYNMDMSSMSAGQNNPMMKYMPYMMPVFLLVFFNRFAAALALYYFISNLITLIIMLVIKKFIIDEDKIHAELEEKKKQKPQKSKLLQRMEEMQKRQQQAAKLKNQR